MYRVSQSDRKFARRHGFRSTWVHSTGMKSQVRPGRSATGWRKVKMY